MTAELLTPRLRLRAWRESDRAPFARLNADPVVMEHFPATLDRDESDAMVERVTGHFQRHGFGFWAVESPGVSPFLGFVGLSIPDYETPFTPCVEIGWRLRRESWGRGYATEAARAAIDFGFRTLGLDEIVSFTVPANQRSRRVMEKLGMGRDPRDDFNHPKLPVEHTLSRHVLYRLRLGQWYQNCGARAPSPGI